MKLNAAVFAADLTINPRNQLFGFC
jgi:hypothetical protein